MEELNNKENDTQVLDDLLRSPQKLSMLLSQVKRLANDTTLHKDRGKALSDDVKLTAKDTFNLSTKKMNELISDWNSGKLEARIAEKTSTIDVLEEFKRLSDSEGGGNIED